MVIQIACKVQGILTVTGREQLADEKHQGQENKEKPWRGTLLQQMKEKQFTTVRLAIYKLQTSTCGNTLEY